MKKIISVIIAISIFMGTVFVVGAEPQNVQSPSVILMEQSSGRVLYEKNADEQRAIASVTKVMTALLVMEAIDGGKIKYDDMVTTSELAESMGGSQVYLEVGEQMTVEDMIKGLMIASGNDVAVALGEHISGNLPDFIKLMNNRAKELGMKNTNFVNPNGLPDDNHYSSARDVAIMSKELVDKHPDIIKYTTIWMDSLRGGEFQLANTNKLIPTYKGITGLKTGFTTDAMHCLSATATRDNLSLVAVILGGPSSEIRFKDAAILLDYGFDNFEFSETIQQGDVIKNIPVIKGKVESVNGVAENNYTILDEKNTSGEITKEAVIEENITAPVTKGQKLGTLVIKKGDTQIGELNIVAETDVPHRNVFDIIKLYFLKWMGIK